MHVCYVLLCLFSCCFSGVICVFVLFVMSWEIIWFAAIEVFVSIFVPGIKEVFIPVFTLSPNIVPSLRLPVSIFLFFIVIFICFSSSRRFAVMVPAPKLQFSPIILSPTYDKWAMCVLSMMRLFLISTAFPILVFLPRLVPARI